MIYADNAATTCLNQNVLTAMLPFLKDDYANPATLYSFSRNSKIALEKSRAVIANCLNCNESEIYFTSGGTEGDNFAIKSILPCDKNCAIAISAIEHHAIINSANFIKSLGYPIYIIPCNKNGIVTCDSLENIFLLAKKNAHNIKLVSIMAANNEIGTIEPIKNLCQVAHKNNALFHSDCVAAMGHITFNFKDLNLDIASTSAHKFCGPKGAGFLYIKNGLDLPSLFHGGSQENNKRAGTQNVAGVVGTATALKIAYKELNDNQKLLLSLEKELLNTLKDSNIDFIRNGTNQLPGHLSISLKDCDGELFLHRLDLMGVCVSTGSACNSNKKVISHVLRAIKLSHDYAKGTIRITFGSNNKIGDGAEIAKDIIKIMQVNN